MATFNKNLYRIQEVLSAGVIGGMLTPSNPLHSVRFNGTPVAKQNGDLNFREASIELRTGTQDQTPVKGFESVAITEAVGTELEPFEWVTQQIVSGFSRVRVVLRYPNGLYRYSSKGKYQSWNMRYQIEVSTDNSEWVSVVDVNSSGRSSQSFDRVHIIDNPTDSETFYIRCRRNHGYGNEREMGGMAWFANVLLEQMDLSYPGTAYASLTFDAASTGNTLPERGYRIRGIECLVPDIYEPTQYDPNTGEITAHAFYRSTVWDGTFITAHCNDPVWIAYNMLVNEEWGAGKTVDSSYIDIYSFFDASRYNVELVDDEVNPPHPRFVFNGRVNQIDDAQRMANTVLAVCQATIYEENGLIRVYQDRPSSPSKLFVRSNVVDGNMSFSSSPLSNRLTVAEITYNDRNNNFEPVTEIVEASETLLDQYGYRITNIMQNGVVDRPQAIRAARYVLENSLIEGQSVNLSVGWENWDASISDLAYVLDETLYPEAIQARVRSVAGEQIEVLNPLPRDFIDERIIFNVAGGIIETTASGNQGETFFIVDLPDAELELRINDAFVITDDDLPLYRVNAFQYNGGEKALILGFHDPAKYGRIETGEDWEPVYPPVDPEDILPPRNLGAFGNISEGERTLYIAWEAPADPDDDTLTDTRISNYFIEINGPNGLIEVSVASTDYALESAALGAYEISVTAMTESGTPSPPATVEYDFIVDGSSRLLPPASIGATFTGKDMTIRWTENPLNAQDERYSTDAYLISIGDTILLESRSVRMEYDEEQQQYLYTYNFDDNVADHGEPVRGVYFGVQVIDNMGLLSEVREGGIENLAPLAPVQTLNAGIEHVQVSIEPDATLPDWENDVVGFLMEVNGEITDLGNSTLTSFQGSPEVEYIVRTAAYDVFGKTDLNWSPSESISVGGIDIPEIPDFSRTEYIFTGLEWSLNNENGAMTWNAHTVSRFAWNPDTNAYDRTDQNIASASLPYDSSQPYIVLDFDNATYIRATFDNWYTVGDHLMGEVRSVDGEFEWYDEGVNKLAVNAISAKHIQADAIVGEKINARTTIVIGDRGTGPNVIILDGTATGSEAIIWVGDQESAAAGFGVTAAGDALIRGNASIGGNALIEASTTIMGSLDIGGGAFTVDSDTGDFRATGDMALEGAGYIGEDMEIRGVISASQVRGARVTRESGNFSHQWAGTECVIGDGKQDIESRNVNYSYTGYTTVAWDDRRSFFSNVFARSAEVIEPVSNEDRWSIDSSIHHVTAFTGSPQGMKMIYDYGWVSRYLGGNWGVVRMFDIGYELYELISDNSPPARLKEDVSLESNEQHIDIPCKSCEKPLSQSFSELVTPPKTQNYLWAGDALYRERVCLTDGCENKGKVMWTMTCLSGVKLSTKDIETMSGARQLSKEFIFEQLDSKEPNIIPVPKE
ncbi:hypothetical protein ABKY80_003688 [Vibrio harveyi]